MSGEITCFKVHIAQRLNWHEGSRFGLVPAVHMVQVDRAQPCWEGRPQGLDWLKHKARKGLP